MGTAFPVIWRPASDYLRMEQSAGLELEDVGTLVSLWATALKVRGVCGTC